MKFGIFYEHQLPRPWTPDAEYELFHQSLDQIELADRIGFDYAWEVEHHFLEEYSHSSATGSSSSRRTTPRESPSGCRPWTCCHTGGSNSASASRPRRPNSTRSTSAS